MTPQMQLRFVMRDGKKILQMRYVGYVRKETKGFWGAVLGPDIEQLSTPWGDVPLVEEEQ